MGSISSLTSSSSLQSILQSALQKSGSTSSAASATDQSSVSPLAKLLGELQTLQQSNPSEYQQVTAQIATNLTSAAKADTASGNTSGAQQLTQLATDFTNASTSGQLPNLQDLAQAIGGGGSHHHHHHGGSGSSSSDSSGSSSSSSDSTSTPAASTATTTTTASQALAAYQSSSNQTSSTNALSIIQDTLNSFNSSN